MKYLLFFLMIACSSPKGALTNKARELEIYAVKPTQCQVVGKIIGQNSDGSTELATNDALNQAAKLDATGIFVNQEVPNGILRAVHATAYKCD
jgi:hypothetical protein